MTRDERKRRERPILFKGPLVRAILEGRKTQTRRIIKDRKRKDGAKLVPELLQQIGIGHACPYGVPGDELWVRETFCAWSGGKTDGGEEWDLVEGRLPPENFHGLDISYKADGKNSPDRWRSPIFMPRWASRISLRITDVRVQRLQEISEEDAIAEGAQCAGFPAATTNVGAFAGGWNKISGPGSWESNPWVWAITFEKLSRGPA